MVRMTQRVTRAWSQELQAHDLSPAQFNVIATIGGQPGLSQQDLSGKLLVTQGNTSQLLHSLIRRGLIERHVSGKEKQLHLTSLGQQLFGTLVPFHEDWLVEQFAALSGEEQQQLALLMQRLDRARR